MNAIVFDMDGVLVNSEQHWQDYLSNDIVPRTIEGDEFSIAAIQGKNRHDIWQHLADNHNLCLNHDEFISRYSAKADEIYSERIDFLEGGVEFIEDLRSRGLQLAIASSSPTEWIDTVTERFGIRELFDAVVSAEEIDGPGKPDENIYQQTVSELDCEPDQSIAVEDSVHGMQAATAAGLYCIGFSRSYTIQSSDVPADAVADSPEELFDLIRSRL